VGRGFSPGDTGAETVFKRCLLLLVALLPVQGDQHLPFDPGRFPASKFSIEQKRLAFGPLTIQLTQAWPLHYEGNDPIFHGCSAFVEVRRGSQFLDARSFEAIGVGSPLGLILPKHQPLAEYFMLVKTGDYDSRTILVGTDGRVRVLGGDKIVIDAADGWLISDSGPAEDGTVRIFDYRQGRQVFQQHSPDYEGHPIAGWYRWNNRLFITLLEVAIDAQRWDRVYFLDLKTRAFLPSSITPELKHNAVRLADEPFDYVGDCTFGARTR
jgi:hypothetical protein